MKVVPDFLLDSGRTFHHNLSETSVKTVIVLPRGQVGNRQQVCGELQPANVCPSSLSGHQSQITTIQTEVSSSNSSTEKSLQLKISELLAMLEQRQTTITKQEEVCHMTYTPSNPR